MLGNDRTAESIICPECGRGRISETIELQYFPYGLAPSTTTLSAAVPVKTCANCGFQSTDERAEEARHAAICAHLGRLSPTQLVAVRNINSLSRVELSEIGGFGIASLQRWETGSLIQNEANDRLIYLLQFRENIDRLRNYHPSVVDPEANNVSIMKASGDELCRRIRQFRHVRDRRQVEIVASQWELRGR
jgi:DNA-binding transcriptional regulator YiaG